MNNALAVPYESYEMQFRDDGWFNATAAALRFGKAPNDWLMLLGTAEYICALAEHLTGDSRWDKEINEFNKIYEKRMSSAVAKAKLLKLVKSTQLVVTKQGGAAIGGGTWLHPNLAIPFARWLNAEFAVWCDKQIYNIIQGESHQDLGKLKHGAMESFTVMSEALREVRSVDGKTTTELDYTNEAKLISDLIMGCKAQDPEDLAVVSYLKTHNTAMIACGMSYEDRKKALAKKHQAYIDKKQKRLPTNKDKAIKDANV